MTRNNDATLRIFCTMVVITFCAGCAYSIVPHDYEDHVDLSDSATGGVATIRGSKRSFLGMMGEYCWIMSPAKAVRVTVDAGMVDIDAVCVFADAMMVEDTTVYYYASFRFDALAGHEYEIGGRCRGCFRLRDVTADEVVAESPHTHH